MTRVSDAQRNRNILSDIVENYKAVTKKGQEISSGYKVSLPGDSNRASSINDFHNSLERVRGYQARIKTADGYLRYQDDLVNQAVEMTTRAKEIASQAANGTVSADTRAVAAREIFQIRDQMVAVANSTYQGKYIYGGTDDDDPPFDAATYTAPATGAESQRYVYDADGGNSGTNTFQIADNVSIRVNTPGNTVFGSAIEALERLGRALAGYDTLPASGTPDGTGAALNLPSAFNTQTTLIQGAIDLLDTSRTDALIPERVDLGARLKRLETVTSLLDSTKATAEDSLDALQNADSATTIAEFQQAQYALQASMQVSSKVLNLSILDYL